MEGAWVVGFLEVVGLGKVCEGAAVQGADFVGVWMEGVGSFEVAGVFVF